MNYCSLSSFAVALGLIVFTCSAAAAVTPGSIEIHTIPGTPQGDRYFFSYFPRSLANATSSVPLAMVLHEMGQSCFDLITNDVEAHLTQTAEELQVMVVAPCGLKGGTGVSWNSGVCCGWNDNPNAPDDVKFLGNVLAATMGLAPIDERRVAAVGMGNGGFMAQMLGCYNPSSFKLIATVAGMVTISPGDEAGQQLCTDLLALGGSVRPKVVMVQGDQDGVVGWSSSPVVHLLTPVENFVAWGARNGCVTGLTGYPVDVWSNTNFESRIYNSSCLGGATVEMVRWWGGGHTWPSQQANAFDATTYFFNALLGM